MLPEACGLPPIGTEGIKDPEELASRLRRALHEIRMAYPTLIHRLEMAIYAAFDVNKDTEARSLIAGRAAHSPWS